MLFFCFCICLLHSCVSFLIYFYLQILFATFDPPDPLVPGVAGHFCIIGLNLVKKRFELLDSLRGPNDPDTRRVVHLMARNIKKLWREASISKGHSFEPKSIDDFKLHYVPTAKQLTS